MTVAAPPAPPGVSRGAARVFGMAAVGASLAFAALLVVSVLIAMAVSLGLRAYGLWTWVKVGLLTALLSLRAVVTATVEGGPFFGEPGTSAAFHWRLVPMLLTIGFLVLAVRAGRRAVRDAGGLRPLAAICLAAAGAGSSVAASSALVGSLVTLRFPSLGVTVEVSPGNVAMWAGITAAAGVAVGAFLERSRSRRAAAVLRGGLIGYGWALFLLSVGILVVATLEPTATRAYVDGLRNLGGGGVALFGAHLLALPAQSALLLAPSAGACLRVMAEGGGVELCPWTLTGIGSVGSLLIDRVSLTPVLWTFASVPPICAALAGRRSGLDPGVVPSVATGALAGVLLASVAVAGAWYVSPQLPVLTVPEVTVQPNLAVMGAVLTLWGLLGGALGGWLAARRYEAPGSPSPTSA